MKYAEIFFDPQSHLPRGVPFKTIIEGLKEGLDKGKKEFGFDYNLIMCFLRHLPEEDAIKTLKEALPYKNDILGVGLDSSEVGFPPKLFKNVYEMASKEGFKLVAHACEEGDPSYAYEALDLLHVSRIDHGIRCLEDEKLIDKIVKNKIPLTLCPLSNKELKVIPDLSKYPIRKMIEKKMITVINSDDPSYFGGYIGDNYWALVESIQFSLEEIVQCAKYSFMATFLSNEKKEKYFSLIDSSVKSLK